MSKFSKHHYEFIARILWHVYNSPEVYSIKQLDNLLEYLIAEFKADNERFNEDKFRKAARSFQ